MSKFYFDYRDIFRAPRYALSGKKILLELVGLLIGYAGFLVLAYLAQISNGSSIKEVYDSVGLLPLYDLHFQHWYGWLLFILGCVWFLAFFLIYNTALSKVTYEQLQGDEFYSSKDALKFVKTIWKTVLLSPLSLIGFVIFLVILAVIVGLLGKIPYLGELGWGFFYLVPFFVVALFAVYVILILSICFFFAPVVIATLKADTFETVVQLFSTIWNQPWRFFIYSGILAVLAKMGMFVFGYFCYRAIQFINLSAGIAMGDKLDNLVDRAVNYVFSFEPVVTFITNLFPGTDFNLSYNLGFLLFTTEGADLSWAGEIGSFLIGISFILIVFVTVAFGLATFTCGQTISWVILYQKKENENLLERKTEEETEVVKEEKTEEKAAAKTRK